MDRKELAAWPDDPVDSQPLKTPAIRSGKQRKGRDQISNIGLLGDLDRRPGIRIKVREFAYDLDRLPRGGVKYFHAISHPCVPQA
ncbi:hypothetical protein P3T76_010577 [Phytophthora citrophthora]|uniref:Uncharacterized protein n=1 Tax=Phytophthora citrophthora TaxID=4793 RepID=A0AAD9GBM0_9STRA|nr:hypothetical protein P3T76_010577 [Phytophthora citrophthora]